jgi:hypothetical protein
VKRRAPFAAALGLLVACVAGAARGQDFLADLAQGDVDVVTETGTHRFRVWIAADDASRARGLMFLRELPADRGMLFLFEHPDWVAFWMKNTYLSLDLVFIDAAGKVVNIARDSQPLSLQPIRSDGPVVAVLELLSGTASRIGLAQGDQVRRPAFDARP